MGMKTPYLRCWDVTLIKVFITDEMGENGCPEVVTTFEGKSNFNEKAKTVRTADGQLVQLSAIVTIGKDIAPEAKVIAGYVEYRGREWKIFSGARPSNPDGSVNHTRLELI